MAEIIKHHNRKADPHDRFPVVVLGFIGPGAASADELADGARLPPSLDRLDVLTTVDKNGD